MIHQKYELSSDGLDLCKGKLVPGIAATWGEIVGDIENQADLVEYVNSHGGGGNAEWGSITGTITDQEDLMTLLDDYATQDWVEGKGYLVSADLSQYATRQWVTGRGYITSDALNGYATETWVGQQGYITSAALTGYATETWVGQQGYCTDEDVVDIVTDDMPNVAKFVDKGLDYDVIDRPNNSADPEYLTTPYILGADTNPADQRYVYVDGAELMFVEREYDDGDLVNEWIGGFYREWPGYYPLEVMSTGQDNPDFREDPFPEDYPLESYIDINYVTFGYCDTGETWEFNGVRIGEEGAGIYTITQVEDGSEVTYEEEFKPFALEEDLDVLDTRVSALETNYGNAITITNNILS